MYAFFLMPVLLIALCLIPAFFITRRIAGNFGGFIASMLIGLNVALLSRTPAGFADTDPYNVLMPLYIVWFIIMAWHSDKIKYQVTFSLLAATFLLLYTWIMVWLDSHIFIGCRTVGTILFNKY